MNKLRIAVATAIVSGALIAPGAASAATPPSLNTNASSAIPANGSMDAALLALGVQRAAALDQVVKSQIAAMRAANTQIAQLNAALQKARTAGDTVTAAQRQAQIDALSSQTQLDMIKLQGMVSKQNNAIEMVSNLMSKFATLKNQILDNMR